MSDESSTHGLYLGANDQTEIARLRELCDELRVRSEGSSETELEYMHALGGLFLALNGDSSVRHQMEELWARRRDERLAAIYSELFPAKELEPTIVSAGKEYLCRCYFERLKNAASTEALLKASPYIVDFVEPYFGEIYHYTALPAVVNIIRNGEIWATQCDFLNDTEERRYITNFLDSPRYDGIREPIVRALSSESYQPLTSDPLGRVVADMNRDSFIISFSKDQDSLTLWSGYTNKCGFNIGFDPMSLFYQNSLGEYRIGADCMVGGSVCYMPSDRPCVKLDEMSDRIIRDGARFGLSKSDIDRILAAHVMYAGLFLKSSSMSAENEYRLVYMPIDRTAINIRCKGNIPIPYTIYRDESIIRGAIRSICIGPTNELDITARGINYLVSSAPGIDPEIKITKSRVSLRY